MSIARVLLVWFLWGTPLLGLSQTEDPNKSAPYASEVMTLEQARPLALVGSSQLRVAFLKIFNSELFTKSGEWNDPRQSFRGCLQKHLGQRTEKVCWPSSRRLLEDKISPS